MKECVMDEDQGWVGLGDWAEGQEQSEAQAWSANIRHTRYLEIKKGFLGPVQMWH